MGKHFWMKHIDDEPPHKDEQPGCMWGLVHALHYHHWHSNVRKIIHHRKYEHQTHLTCDWSPETKSRPRGANEVEKLLNEKDDPYHSTKRSRATKRRSLRARIKALIVEDTVKPKEGFNKPNLQRTYSIHHLESLDGELEKIQTDWNRPIIFLPKNVEKKPDDVLEIFKVDKELLMKHLQDADETIANFTRSALGLKLNKKARNLSKSRSFPVPEFSQRRKHKPVKLENKHKEVWSLPREDINNKHRNDEVSLVRSSSLNESMEKYAKLFGNGFGKDRKLSHSKSLKLTNENGHVPVNFRRIRSLNNADSYNSNLNFVVFGDDHFGNGSILTPKDGSSGLENSNEEKELQDEGLVSDSDMISLNEPESNAVELQISEGLEQISDYLDCTNEKLDKTVKCCPKENNSDLYYVRNLLEQSGISIDPYERPWHASDQPLGPQLFEDVEARWPHDQDHDQLTESQEFYGCWHHQMLFDLVNEVLMGVYDRSLPYYPKALSSSCHVGPFFTGERIIDDVNKRVGSLVSMKPEEKGSLDCIVGRDLANDASWMNLQMETECVGLDIEDLIFDELLEEVMCS